MPAAARSRSIVPAFILARDAVVLANEAFFDPGMMGQQYFPDQHKFAVYTPLFAPVAVSVVVSMLRELKSWKARKRARAEEKRKKKEAAQQEGETASSATATGVQTRAAAAQ